MAPWGGGDGGRGGGAEPGGPQTLQDMSRDKEMPLLFFLPQPKPPPSQVASIWGHLCVHLSGPAWG